MKLKNFFYLIVVSSVMGFTAVQAKNIQIDDSQVGIVSFKKCLEDSRQGQEEQGNLNEMRNKMIHTLEEDNAKLQELTATLQDSDYLDSVSKDEEERLRNEYLMLTEGLGQKQQQFYQVLNQANYKMIQNIAAEISIASEKIAQVKNLTVVLNEEACFYFQNKSDITGKVIQAMNDHFDYSLQASAQTTDTTEEVTE